MLHYKQLVETKPEWELVDIYVDEAISGTQINKHIDFQRMINDALEGKIDMIIIKSISRFARNTLDTLKYVRLLKEKNVAIMFEKENINTLTMNGEMLLVILSSGKNLKNGPLDHLKNGTVTLYTFAYETNLKWKKEEN